ncbi:MAG: hypothetical protein WAU41_00950 [Gaiellaceae bacterium]|jgi:hypothetical protein
MTAWDVSPELALVDPVLRESAIARLPPLQAFDFLKVRSAAREPAVAAPAERRPPLLLAGAIYTLATLGRVLVMDLLVVLAIALAITGIQVFF